MSPIIITEIKSFDLWFFWNEFISFFDHRDFLKLVGQIGQMPNVLIPNK